MDESTGPTSWPPPVFREVGDPAGATRRFELTDLDGGAAGSIAAVPRDAVWAIVELRGGSDDDLLRLVVEVSSEAVRAGATMLSIGPGCGPAYVDLLRRRHGGRTRDSCLLIEL